jgi:hypothetical protein
MEVATMRSAKNQAHSLTKTPAVEGAAAPDLASLGLLEDDGAEDTAVRARPTEVTEEEPPASCPLVS